VNKGIAFVVGVSLMNAVAMMIVIPVLPRLIQSFTGSTAGAAHYGRRCCLASSARCVGA
jgi:hypothetical protein